MIRLVPEQQTSLSSYNRRVVGCLILSADNKILLQQRPKDWGRFPDCLATFGGGIEKNESPIQALVRELNEELGAKVEIQDVVSLGAITEPESNYQDLIHVYFWHDKKGTITGCYEGEAVYYNSAVDALKHPKIMNDVLWLLQQCEQWLPQTGSRYGD
jgi:8-oxo-dGTP diphosphatase